MTPTESIILSIIITFFIFVRYEYKTSFLELYSRLFNSTPKQQRKILDKLIYYLAYTNEELATFNAGNYKRIPYQLLYHIFRFVFILLTIYFIFNFGNRFQITVLQLILLILLLPTFIISLPTIILWLDSKNFKPDLERIKALRNAIFGNFVASYLTVSSIFLIYLFINILSKIDLLGIFAFPDSGKPIRLESINGNILSMASIYFTLAIGGTVVFSVLKRHHEQIDKLGTKIDELKIVYIKWIEEKRLNDKIFNFKKAKTFNAIVNDLRDKVEPEKINKLKEPVRLFDFFIFFIFIYYFMGVLSIISNGFLIDWIFAIGWSSLIPYIFTLFLIFKYYQ